MLVDDDSIIINDKNFAKNFSSLYINIQYMQVVH